MMDLNEQNPHSGDSEVPPRSGAGGFTVWFTGLSGAGKTTLANAMAAALQEAGHQVEVLDGDEFRKALGGDLGFSKEDRETNVSRLGYVAALLSRHGVAVLVAAIAPYRAAREAVRRGHNVPFIEVFVDCHMEAL
jgi:adenylylsulfate kinase